MINQSAYLWTPKKGVSLDAVERMRAHTRKPLKPMGEAWFMSEERRLYTELMEKPFEEILNNGLSEILFEISSGTSCFGHLEEWDDWFRYLLPDLIVHSRDHKFFLIYGYVQQTVTAFMSVYWKEIVEEYKGFREDVINSLSLCLMNNEFWFDYKDKGTGEVYPKTSFLSWEEENGQWVDWDAGRANENLSAMLFFCLKYLYAEEIVTWVESLFAIRDPYWRGALMVWLLGAYDLLQEPVIAPSAAYKAKPIIRWRDSHVLGSSCGSIDAEYPPDERYNDNKDFLPQENVRLFLGEVRRHMTAEVIMDWADSFSRDEKLLECTYNVPEQLFDKLITNGSGI